MKDYLLTRILVVLALLLGSLFLLNVSNAQYGYNDLRGGGGGGSSSLQRDYCPNGDQTLSYYDGLCDLDTPAQEEVEAITYNTDVVVYPNEAYVEEMTSDEALEVIKRIEVVKSTEVESISRGEFVLPLSLPKTGA